MNGTDKAGYYYPGCTGFHTDCGNEDCPDHPFQEMKE